MSLAHYMREETVTESVREERALPVVNWLCTVAVLPWPSPESSAGVLGLGMPYHLCIKNLNAKDFFFPHFTV